MTIEQIRLSQIKDKYWGAFRSYSEEQLDNTIVVHTDDFIWLFEQAKKANE